MVIVPIGGEMRSYDSVFHSSLHRLHTRCIEISAQLTTYARSYRTSEGGLYTLDVYQVADCLRLIRDFAFNVRCAVEQADKVRTGFKDEVEKVKLHIPRPVLTDAVEGKKVHLTQQTFWWTVNRLIHAGELSLEPMAIDLIEYTNGARSKVLSFDCFRFRSDKDQPGTMNFATILGLVTAFYCSVEPGLEDAAEKRAFLEVVEKRGSDFAP